MDINDFLTFSFCYVVLLLLFKLCSIMTKCSNQIELLIPQEETDEQEQEPEEQPQEQEQEQEPEVQEEPATIKKVITLKDVKIFVSKIRVTKLKPILTRMRQRLMIPAWYTKYDFEKLLETSITDADWEKLLSDFPDVNQFVIEWYNNRNSKSSSESDEPVPKRTKKVVRKVVLSESSDDQLFKTKHQIRRTQPTRKVILSESSE